MSKTFLFQCVGAVSPYGHHHFRQRRPVDDRPGLAAVGVGDLVQHDALARVEADPHGPLLPLHLPAVDGEARPVGLGDLDRLDVVAELGERRPVVLVEHELLGVVARSRRQRHHPVVLDVDDLHGVEVERDDQALDRSRVAVLRRRGTHERQRATDQRRVVVVILRCRNSLRARDRSSRGLKSVTPRLRIASCHRGSSRTTSPRRRSCARRGRTGTGPAPTSTSR